MTHYVCKGSCLGEWPKPGLCDSQFCSKEGKPLITCDCADGMHEHAGEEEKEEEDPDLM